MNLELFIAKRVIWARQHKSSVSSTIIKIAIAAIAMGMVMMLIAMATGFGLQRKIRDKVAAFNGHVIIGTYDNNRSLVSVNPLPGSPNWLPPLKEREGIAHIQGFANKGGVIHTSTHFEGVVLKGVGVDYDWINFNDFLVEGRLPDLQGKLNGEILMSTYMANRLLVGVGDKVDAFFLKEDSSKMPNQRRFTITGLYDSNFQEFDATYVLGDIRHVQRMNLWKSGEVGGFEVFIDDFSEMERMGLEVFTQIPSVLNSETIAERYINIFEWVKLFDFNVALIIVIMILVAGINMITALLVLILERTPMIGILKAMGSKNKSIRRIFLYNATYLIALGLIIGNIVGLGLLWIQETYGVISLDPSTYFVSKAPVYLHWGHVVLLNVGTLLLCLLMLLLPSILITKIQPIKAIRFE